MNDPFADFDFADFWDDSEYIAREYTDDPLTLEKIALVEHELGYKLPASYIALMQRRNGGVPVKNNHRMTEATTWASDHVTLYGLFSIGGAKTNSLLGEAGSKFWIADWEYPPIGIYFGDCPSAGHDMFCLDYRAGGEPTVAHIDQEWDYKITPVAPNFESFIRNLEPDEAFPDPDDEP